MQADERTTQVTWLLDIPYILKSNPYLWKDDGEDKDDSDWVTDSDSVMGDYGESDE